MLRSARSDLALSDPSGRHPLSRWTTTRWHRDPWRTGPRRPRPAAHVHLHPRHRRSARRTRRTPRRSRSGVASAPRSPTNSAPTPHRSTKPSPKPSPPTEPDERLEPGRVVSGHVGACAFCRICKVLVRLSMHVLFAELPEVNADRLHLTHGTTLEVAVDLQEFGLEVPTRRIEHPRAPPRVHVQWMLELTQVQRRQGDLLIGIEVPARPGQHVARPTREERLIRSLPRDPLIRPLDRGTPKHPRRRHTHAPMLPKLASHNVKVSAV